MGRWQERGSWTPLTSVCSLHGFNSCSGKSAPQLAICSLWHEKSKEHTTFLAAPMGWSLCFISFLTGKSGRSKAVLHWSQQQGLLQGNEELGVEKAPLRNHLCGCWVAQVIQHVSQKELKNWRHFDHFLPRTPQNWPYLKETLVISDPQNKPVSHSCPSKVASSRFFTDGKIRRKQGLLVSVPKSKDQLIQ